MPAFVNIFKECNVRNFSSPAQYELMFCNVLGITDLELSCLYSPLEKDWLSLCSSVPSSS